MERWKLDFGVITKIQKEGLLLGGGGGIACGLEVNYKLKTKEEI